MEDKKRKEYILISISITAIIFIILYIIYNNLLKQYIKIPECIFYLKFNIYCPGCGCTRAFNCLINGKIIESLYYNPTVLYSLIALILYFMFNLLYIIFNINIKIIKKEKYLFYIGIVIMISTCIIRNILKIVYNITL